MVKEVYLLTEENQIIMKLQLKFEAMMMSFLENRGMSGNLGRIYAKFILLSDTENPYLTQKILKKDLKIHASTVSRNLAFLEKYNIIDREPFYKDKPYSNEWKYKLSTGNISDMIINSFVRYVNILEKSKKEFNEILEEIDALPNDLSTKKEIISLKGKITEFTNSFLLINELVSSLIEKRKKP